MTSTKDLHEGEVTTTISELSILVAVIELQVLDSSGLECLLSWPLKSQGPSLVTKPVADEVSIAGIDENWDLLEDSWNKTVELDKQRVSVFSFVIDLRIAPRHL